MLKVKIQKSPNNIKLKNTAKSPPEKVHDEATKKMLSPKTVKGQKMI